jgi:hypothetical protein
MYTIIAGRSSDDSGWMNILFFIVLGIIWAIQSIAKVKSNKSQQFHNRPKAEQLNPLRHPLTSTSLRKLKFDQFAKKIIDAAELSQNKPKQNVPVFSPGHNLKSSKKEALPVVPISDSNSQTNSQTINNINDIKPEKINSPINDISTDYENYYSLNDILDFSEKDQLQKAIVYMEVLGKPKALRESEYLLD